jgi:hypothetical protein
MKTWADQGEQVHPPKGTTQPSAADSKFGWDTEHCSISWNVKQQINSSLKREKHEYPSRAPTLNASKQMSDEGRRQK